MQVPDCARCAGRPSIVMVLDAISLLAQTTACLLFSLPFHFDHLPGDSIQLAVPNQGKSGSTPQSQPATQPSQTQAPKTQPSKTQPSKTQPPATQSTKPSSLPAARPSTSTYTLVVEGSRQTFSLCPCEPYSCLRPIGGGQGVRLAGFGSCVNCSKGYPCSPGMRCVEGKPSADYGPSAAYATCKAV